MSNRPARLVLLLVAIAFLARDFRDATAISPVPVVSIPPPAPSCPENILKRQQLGGFSRYTPSPKDKQLEPARPAVSADNSSIAIGGNNTGSATVNTFSDRLPRPGVVPKVNFCVSQPTPALGELFKTIIAVTTATQITQPFWAFFFDNPVIDATSTVRQAGTDLPHTLNHGHPAAAPGLPNPDTILRLQIIIGTPMSGVEMPFSPGQEISFTVTSKQPVHLTQTVGGYGTELLKESIMTACGSQ